MPNGGIQFERLPFIQEIPNCVSDEIGEEEWQDIAEIIMTLSHGRSGENLLKRREKRLRLALHQKIQEVNQDYLDDRHKQRDHKEFRDLPDCLSSFAFVLGLIIHLV